jgi:hypothetical protein
MLATTAPNPGLAVVGQRTGDQSYLIDWLPSVSSEAMMIVQGLTQIRDSLRSQGKRYDLTGLFGDIEQSAEALAGGITLQASYHMSVLKVDRQSVWFGPLTTLSRVEEGLLEDQTRTSHLWRNVVRALSGIAIRNDLGIVEQLLPLPTVVIRRTNPADPAQERMVLFGLGPILAMEAIERDAPVTVLEFPDLPDYDARNIGLHLQVLLGSVSVEESFRQVTLMGEDYVSGRCSSDSQPFPEKASDLAEFLGCDPSYVYRMAQVWSLKATRRYISERQLSVNASYALVTKLRHHEDLLERGLQQAAANGLSVHETRVLAKRLAESLTRKEKRDPGKIQAKRLLTRLASLTHFLAEADALDPYLEDELAEQLTALVGLIQERVTERLDASVIALPHDDHAPLQRVD